MASNARPEASNVATKMVGHISRVLEGKRDVVEHAVTALLARGHLLIEDVPGVGKTTLARALSKTLGLSFRRLQFTSDLMPADVLGGNVFDAKTGQFSFRRGPVFTQILLADEINRTTPRTQSALLEAMDERQVSVDGETHPLQDPFFVIATQNPEEFYGTYPLPESQLDRFIMRVRIGYPPREVERGVLAHRRNGDPAETLDAIVTEQELLAAQREVDAVRVDDAVLDYLHALVLRTRETPFLTLGVSTRGALAFERAVRATALVHGRGFALPDDVKTVAASVLSHRVRLTGTRDNAASAREAERVINDLLNEIPVPL